MTGPREADRPGVPRANGVRLLSLSDGVLADPVTVAVLADDPVTGLNAVTREEIKNVFQRRIHPDKMALIVVGEKQP